MLPGDFDQDGNLPSGVHVAGWAEFKARFGSTARREVLLGQMEALLTSLAGAGCTAVYINGSFTTAKDEPGDYDLCWDPVGVDPSLLDPVILKIHPPRLEQHIKYGGDIFPANMREAGSQRTFLDFFQMDKATGKPKGIVQLVLRRQP